MKILNTYYIVQYNDCYSNGEKQNECLVKDKNAFKSWLKKRNKNRLEQGEMEENEEEFNLIPINLVE